MSLHASDGRAYAWREPLTEADLTAMAQRNWMPCPYMHTGPGQGGTDVFKPNDIVKCVRPHSGMINRDHYYRVLVVVETGWDYRGPTSGVIVHPVAAEPQSYPYVWDVDRFVKVDGPLTLNDLAKGS